MTIQALGYLSIGSPKLADWTDFAGGVLGMQPVDHGGKMRAFRMDDRKQRLIIDGEVPDGERVFGWEVQNSEALSALGARLEAAGVSAKQEASHVTDQRCVSDLISFSDPAGNHLEAFYGPQIADTPFVPSRDISGFRTGPQGMGHVLLMVPRLDETLKFYLDVLGFRISDFIRSPVSAYFLHVNSRHHSLALVEGPKSAMHHLMVELFSFDDVGQGYDVAQSDENRIAAKLGRHPNDLMTSFYSRTPSDILVEYGWGGREVDDDTWQPHEMTSVGSFWGHQGLFESLADAPHPGAAPPPAMRKKSQRAPVQVMEGNYERMRGVCPWWDAHKN
jgi:2,3-dihydroxybiphenyl 1,2-dioxygenase